MKIAIRKDNDTITVATFEYDALGRRIEKVDSIAGKTTQFYYDDQRVVLETDATGTEFDTRYFLYGNYIDEVLMIHRLTGTPADYYYAHDHLYSPVALFDDDGNVVERYEYDAYGTATIMTPTYTLRQSSFYLFDNPYYFTGRRLDTLDDGSCKLMYYRARYYDTQTGRFLQRDPLGVNPAGGTLGRFRQYQDGMNLYEYVSSRPMSMVDPSGGKKKSACDEWRDAPPGWGFLLTDCLLCCTEVFTHKVPCRSWPWTWPGWYAWYGGCKTTCMATGGELGPGNPGPGKGPGTPPRLPKK